MKKHIVTISREYGSGGYDIGRMLSERMGWKFYDKELIAELADRLLVPRSYVEDRDEKPVPRNIFHEAFPIFANADGGQADYIFAEQGKFIVQLARQGNCVFAGRRADFYLRDEPAAMHLFFYADMPFKIARVMELEHCTAEEAEKKILLMDKQRKTSYEYTTGRKWADRHSFDRMICTSSFGIEACVDELEALLRRE